MGRDKISAPHPWFRPLLVLLSKGRIRNIADLLLHQHRHQLHHPVQTVLVNGPRNSWWLSLFLSVFFFWLSLSYYICLSVLFDSVCLSIDIVLSDCLSMYVYRSCLSIYVVLNWFVCLYRDYLSIFIVLNLFVCLYSECLLVCMSVVFVFLSPCTWLFIYILYLNVYFVAVYLTICLRCLAITIYLFIFYLPLSIHQY